MRTLNSVTHRARVWKFGDQINTDLIFPSIAFRMPLKEQHLLAFETIRPGWVNAVQQGDIIVAGENFGMGSSRPVGAVLRACGISLVVAESVNGICLRNCVNDGLPAISCTGVSSLFDDGDTAEVNFMTGVVTNQTKGQTLRGGGLPESLAKIIFAGGLIPMLAGEGLIEATPFAASAT